jgi:hypothetical protein
MRSPSIAVGLVLVLMLAYSVAVYVLVIPQRRAHREGVERFAARAGRGSVGARS